MAIATSARIGLDSGFGPLTRSLHPPDSGGLLGTDWGEYGIRVMERQELIRPPNLATARSEGLEPPTLGLESLRSSEVMDRVRRRLSLWSGKTHARRLSVVAGRFASFRGPRRSRDGLRSRGPGRIEGSRGQPAKRLRFPALRLPGREAPAYVGPAISRRRPRSSGLRWCQCESRPPLWRVGGTYFGVDGAAQA